MTHPYPPVQPTPEPTPPPGAGAGGGSDAEGLEYHEVYRAGRQGWYWYAFGIFTMLLSFLLVGPVLVVLGAIVIIGIQLASSGRPLSELEAEVNALADLDNVTPSVLLFIHVTLIVAIPAAWLCVYAFHGLKPRWLTSIKPRMRWGWFAASFGIAFVALFASILLGAFLPTSVADPGQTTELNAWSSTMRDFVLIVVLLTPFQAAAEEYVFRGYLTQAFGAWGGKWVAVLAPATLFALAHGAQSVPIFIDRFAFGVVAGVMVIMTGGLESAIAYHVLNNLLAFGFAIAFSDLTTALNPEGGNNWDIVVTILKSCIFVGLAILVGRKMGVGTRTDPAVLARPISRV